MFIEVIMTVDSTKQMVNINTISTFLANKEGEGKGSLITIHNEDGHYQVKESYEEIKTLIYDAEYDASIKRVIGADDQVVHVGKDW